MQTITQRNAVHHITSHHITHSSTAHPAVNNAILSTPLRGRCRVTPVPASVTLFPPTRPRVLHPGHCHSSRKAMVIKGRSTNIDAKVRLMRSWRRSKEGKRRAMQLERPSPTSTILNARSHGFRYRFIPVAGFSICGRPFPPRTSLLFSSFFFKNNHWVIPVHGVFFPGHLDICARIHTRR